MCSNFCSLLNILSSLIFRMMNKKSPQVGKHMASKKVVFVWFCEKSNYSHQNCKSSWIGSRRFSYNLGDFPIFNSLIRFQRALNVYHSIIFSWDMTKNAFGGFWGPKVPNFILGPRPTNFLKILKFSDLPISSSLICFQRALNHYQAIILSQVMNFFPIIPILGTLWPAPSAQIW